MPYDTLWYTTARDLHLPYTDYRAVTVLAASENEAREKLRDAGWEALALFPTDSPAHVSLRVA